MICLYRAFPVWEFPIHVKILRNLMTRRPNLMPHPGFEKVLMRNWDFFKLA
jgi:hypothetical protein